MIKSNIVVLDLEKYEELKSKEKMLDDNFIKLETSTTYIYQDINKLKNETKQFDSTIKVQYQGKDEVIENLKNLLNKTLDDYNTLSKAVNRR